jgi:hypothetical protein
MYYFVIVPVALLVAGCSGLTQMQDSLNKFGSGATSVSTTEMAFLNNVQTFDCTVQFYSNASDWAVGAAANYDLTGACKPQIITTNQIAIRQHMLDALTAYAGKIQALASTAGDQTLDTAGQKLATQINTLATSPGGITKSDATIAADVEAALIQLANMALDQARYDDAKKAASAMQPYLQSVVTELEKENTNYATAIEGAQGKLELSLRKVVDTAPASNPTSRFESVVAARGIVRSANPFGVEVLAPATGIPTPNPAAMNSALDSVVTANGAIANASDGGISAAVTDLVSRAQAAQADVNAITK